MICITALEGDKKELKGNQRRKKLIFYKEETTKSGWVYRCYLVNNDKSFIEMCDSIDNLSSYLCVVNKNTIVGVNYYDLTANTLTLNENCVLAGIKKIVEISKDLEVKEMPAKDAFSRIKTYHSNRVLFQKKAIGYKEDMGL